MAGCALFWTCSSYNLNTRWSWAPPTQELLECVTALWPGCALGLYHVASVLCADVASHLCAAATKKEVNPLLSALNFLPPSLWLSCGWTGRGGSLLLAELFARALLVSMRRNGWVNQMDQVWQVCGAGRGWLTYPIPWVDGFTSAWALLSHQTLCKEPLKHSCGMN